MVMDTVDARSESCPTASDEIATDRPDVTNSSLVVPVGSFQSENGINLSARDAGRTIDGTNSRWRLGIAPCLEVFVGLPASQLDDWYRKLPERRCTIDENNGGPCETNNGLNFSCRQC